MMWPLLGALLVAWLVLFGIVVVGVLLVDWLRHCRQRRQDREQFAEYRRAIAVLRRGRVTPGACRRAVRTRENQRRPAPKAGVNRPS
ncbi:MULTISPECIES: hypothetical protein [Actinoalloteichus]|nr:MULTISPECIES: hypothetical protein [Actinoalloteichus]